GGPRAVPARDARAPPPGEAAHAIDTGRRSPAAAGVHPPGGRPPGVAGRPRPTRPPRPPPHPDGPVVARRGDPLPVRAVHRRQDLANMAVVWRVGPPAPPRGPPAPPPPPGGAFPARALRAGSGAWGPSRGPPARSQERAGGRVPQLRRLVLAGRGKLLSVRAEGERPDVVAMGLAFGHQLAGSRIEHRQSPLLAFDPANRHPRAVWAHDDVAGLSYPRYFHATNNL